MEQKALEMCWKEHWVRIKMDSCLILACFICPCSRVVTRGFQNLQNHVCLTERLWGLKWKNYLKDPAQNLASLGYSVHLPFGEFIYSRPPQPHPLFRFQWFGAPRATTVHKLTIFLLTCGQKVSSSLASAQAPTSCTSLQVLTRASYHLTSSQEEGWVQSNQVFWKRETAFT